MSLLRRLIISAVALFASLPVAASAKTLDDVRQRGMINCGVNTGLQGFSAKDAAGVWSGFDVDFCRALAAAILDDPQKVNFVPLSAQERFEALKASKVDLLSRNSTWTLDREASMGLLFAGVAYYDGQSFLVMRKPEVTSALELGGAKICVQSGTTTQPNLADYFRANAMQYTEIVFPSLDEATKGLENGACDVLTADQSALYAQRLKLKEPQTAVILPDVISKEPLGPATRADDVAWHNVVKWTLFAMVNAEELGISTQTVAAARQAGKMELARSVAQVKTSDANGVEKPDVLRFVGAEGDFGKKLGLDNDWAVRAIGAVGNYAEVYERNVGTKSPLGIPRGLNQLWSMGGIMYAPPMR